MVYSAIIVEPLGSNLLTPEPGHLKAILVAASREADHHDVFLGPSCRHPHGFHDGMSGFQRGQNAFQPGAELEPFQSVAIRNAGVAHPARVFPVTMLRS